jgi:hypothetical protein
LAFARTVDHESDWIGTADQKEAEANLDGIEDSRAPELSLAADGTVYIVWLGGSERRTDAIYHQYFCS